MRWCSVGIDLLWLSVLWLLGCATIVGAPAATVALAETVRLIQAGREPVIARTFWNAVREHGGIATRVGWLWLALGSVVVVDLLIVLRLGPEWAAAGSVLGLLLLAFLAASVFLPCVVLARAGHDTRQLLRLGVVVAVVRLGATLQAMLVVSVAAFLAVVSPLLLVLLPALCAHSLVFMWRMRIAPVLGAREVRTVAAVDSRA
ncbi:DUF624 domain-containing protein [Occultella aeris]|uniref:DUF624 domain-containing protein n=2 Tax=Occultella aeris TaxID=2761496 RepID=A0A7M4DPK3_9MICO|nr:hypothetical protein HALOF300_04085 [Occultella aeris]